MARAEFISATAMSANAHLKRGRDDAKLDVAALAADAEEEAVVRRERAGGLVREAGANEFAKRRQPVAVLDAFDDELHTSVSCDAERTHL